MKLSGMAASGGSRPGTRTSIDAKGRVFLRLSPLQPRVSPTSQKRLLHKGRPWHYSSSKRPCWAARRALCRPCWNTAARREMDVCDSYPLPSPRSLIPFSAFRAAAEIRSAKCASAKKGDLVWLVWDSSVSHEER